MRTNKIWLLSALILSIAFSLSMTSCQKMERPPLVIIPDPPPPPYNPLKSYWAFENSLVDSGENKLSATAKSITYTAGVTGQAAKIGDGGYIYIQDVSDTIKNLGSFTVAFWMNGTGPVQGGAQGIFSISNKNEFWGNLEIFLENNNNPADPAEAFLKVHLLNAGVSSGNGEEWLADDNMKLPNTLNKWTHIAITYDSTTSAISVYKDGQPKTHNKILRNGNYGPIKYKDVNGMVLGSFAFQTNPSLTNHGPEAWAKSFNGSLDQFRIYNKALTDAQITDLYNSKK